MIAPLSRLPPVRPAPAPDARAGAESESAAAPVAVPDAIVAAVEERLTAYLARQPSAGDIALEAQREAFDEQLALLAEQARETAALTDLAAAQAKHEDELLKKAIEMI